MHQQNPAVLNWRCQLTQIDLYNGCIKVIVVVIVSDNAIVANHFWRPKDCHQSFVLLLLYTDSTAIP